MIRQQALRNRIIRMALSSGPEKVESSVNERSDSYVTRGAQPCMPYSLTSIEPDRSGARKRREEIGGETGSTEAEIVLRQVGLGGCAGRGV
jgi:hypothetical protein